MRYNDYKIGGPEVIDHVDEILKMLSVFTGSNIYIEVKDDLTDSDMKGDITMDVVAERMTKVSRSKGFEEGKKLGLEEGVDMAFELIERLATDNRNDDISRVRHDKEYRLKLMKEYGILSEK